ncbi:MAG TPA: HAD family phosphatase, partial [Jatrophihabitans sp.]|nr:HAD family phosphatase [Jatrophihabitans sp.]
DRPLDAVLWDLDGTLVDTEPSWIAAEYRLVESFGGSWSDEQAKAQVGNPLLVTGQYLREHGGVPLPAVRIVELLLADVLADVRREVHWRPGARRLLAECREQGLATALVTMSYLELAEAVTVRLPAGSFDVLVTGDQVGRGKPDPEAYLLAADRLGVDPARCLAIEDSVTGVAAAEAAGCLVVAVPNQVPIPPADTRTIVSDLASLSLTELIAVALPSTAPTH